VQVREGVAKVWNGQSLLVYEYFHAYLPYELHLEDSSRRMREGGAGQSLAFPFWSWSPALNTGGQSSLKTWMLIEVYSQSTAPAADDLLNTNTNDALCQTKYGLISPIVLWFSSWE
jgi:hypothetical protein